MCRLYESMTCYVVWSNFEGTALIHCWNLVHVLNRLIFKLNLLTVNILCMPAQLSITE